MRSETRLGESPEPRIEIPDRLFSVWDCVPDNASLLLRSCKDDSHEFTIDIEFRGVAFVQLPMFFRRGLVLRAGTATDVEHILGLIGAEDAEQADRLYVVEAPDGPGGFVAAFCVEVSENDLEPTISSLTYSTKPINTDFPVSKKTLLSLDADQRVPGKLTDLLT